MKKILVSISRFFFGVKRTDIDSTTSNLNLSHPFIRDLIKRDTNIFRKFFSISMDFAIRHIFSSRHYTKIGSTIIKTVPVDVVNLKLVYWLTHNSMMKSYGKHLAAYWKAKFSSGITRAALIFNVPPFIFSKVRIAIIDGGYFSTTQGNFDHSPLYQSEVNSHRLRAS